jgi:hypothetical protein
MRRILAVALAASAVAAAQAPGSGTAPGTVVATFVPAAGHEIAGFALDREWLALAEDPTSPAGCPLVRLVAATGGAQWTLTAPSGPTCAFGGRFWVRPASRAIGVALVRALWVVRRGTAAIAVKGSSHEPEVVLARVSGIHPPSGPFLGPVVATNWLRLFGDYTRGAGGTLTGKVISGNRRVKWAATGPVLPLGLDDAEHAVTVGAGGAIAMWHAHGARYGRVENAHARAAALDLGRVLVLRSDRPRLDVRLLSGRLVASWPVPRGVVPLLDADRGDAVFIVGDTVRELDLATGEDRVVARAPAGTRLVDAQIERRLIVYAYRGGPAGRGRVVAVAR